jgi:hypothetical protein
MALRVKSSSFNGYTARENIVDKANSQAQGLRNLYSTIATAIESKEHNIDEFSAEHIARACGVIGERDSWSEHAPYVFARFGNLEKKHPREVFSESNGNLNTDVFQTILTDLIETPLIDSYLNTDDLIGRELVTVQTGSQRRNVKLAGLTAHGSTKYVDEGHPYPELGFGEKYTVSSEDKRGAIYSITMEAMMEDTLGVIRDQMNEIGEVLALDLEEYIIGMVTDTLQSQGRYVYRPSGTGTALYDTDAHLNSIGESGAPTGYTSAIALEDWTDIETVWKFRATQVTDDRIDGTAKPIRNLNMGEKVLLVPNALFGTAQRIQNNIHLDVTTNTNNVSRAKTPTTGLIDKVLTSAFLDAIVTTTWYYGVPKKQFIMRELWPMQVFTQGADSDASFERDIAFRVKARALVGVSAKDTPYFTRVKGA